MLLVESAKGDDVVACACSRAEQAGVLAGMTLAHARSLVHGCVVHIESYNHEDDVRQLHRMAQWALRFSPITAPDEPLGLLLDIAGCEHLYGGALKLAQRVSESLTRLGFHARLAVAPTFACAQAIAACANKVITLIDVDGMRDALAPLPIAALRVEPAVCASLLEIGVEWIGQLLALERKELSARFGGTLMRRLDQALGRGVPEVIEPIRKPEQLEASRIFDGPVTCLEAILTTCHDLLAELVQRLARDESGACGLSFLFRRVGAAPAEVSLRLARASRDPNHLWSLLRPQLERVELGYGVEEIQLRAEQTEPIEHGQAGLWPDAGLASPSAHESDWAQLLDHLIERLGLANVMVAYVEESYVPEQAYPLQSWRDENCANKNGSRRNAESRTHSAARPSRLFAQPEPARVLTVTPDGPLVWLNWRGRERRVYRCIGPERIALSGWEIPAPSASSTALSRDYYMIVDMDGDWLWVFRDGQTSNWFVHGEWT